MPRLIALCVLLCAFCAAAVPDQTTHLIQPKRSPLVLLKLDRQLSKAKYHGKVWVTGTLIARWPHPESERSSDLEILVVPDRDSVDSLPHFTLRWSRGVREYKVQKIEIRNREALQFAMEPRLMQRILDKRVRQARKTGRFLIEAYEVGVECDSPWARATLLAAEIPDQHAALHQPDPEGC